jgi:hypothetical protein
VYSRSANVVKKDFLGFKFFQLVIQISSQNQKLRNAWILQNAHLKYNSGFYLIKDFLVFENIILEVKLSN